MHVNRYMLTVNVINYQLVFAYAHFLMVLYGIRCEKHKSEVRLSLPTPVRLQMKKNILTVTC